MLMRLAWYDEGLFPGLICGCPYRGELDCDIVDCVGIVPPFQGLGS